MFRWALMSSTFCLILATALLARALWRTDETGYAQLVSQQEAPVQSGQAPAGEQWRRGVTKDLFLIQHGQRRQSHFESPSSTVEFALSGKKTHMIERMAGVRAFLQEELIYRDGEPAQQIRCIDAKEASFHYDTGKFVGRDVAFDRFCTTGHELSPDSIPSERSLAGRAQGVEFTLGKGDPDFRADRMRATIYPRQENREVP